MDWKKYGFTQKKPKEHGVYFINSNFKMQNPPPRILDGWDIAEIYFSAGSLTNIYDNREDLARWHVKMLQGIEMCWHKGMWIKGPIKP